MNAIRDAPVHREACCDLRDGGLQTGAVGVQLGEIELDALEKLTRNRVGMLVGVEDVGAVPIENLRERGDEAFAVGAADEQGCGLVHNQVFSR